MINTTNGERTVIKLVDYYYVKMPDEQVAMSSGIGSGVRFYRLYPRGFSVATSIHGLG